MSTDERELDEYEVREIARLLRAGIRENILDILGERFGKTGVRTKRALRYVNHLSTLRALRTFAQTCSTQKLFLRSIGVAKKLTAKLVAADPSSDSLRSQI